MASPHTDRDHSPGPLRAGDRGPAARTRAGGPRGLAFAAAGLFVAVLAWLLSRPGPDFRTQPLEFWDIQNTSESAHGFRSWALPFDEVRSSGEGWEHRVRFESLPSGPQYGWHGNHYRPDPGIRWAELRSVGFHLEPAAGAGPWGRGGPEVLAARLRGPDGSEYALVAPRRVERGRLLELRRVSAPGVAGTTNAGPVELSLLTREPATNLCLRVLVTPVVGSAYGVLRKALAEPSVGGFAWPFGRLTYPQAGAAGSRASLVAGWWKWGGAGGTAVRAVGCALLLLLGMVLAAPGGRAGRLAGIGLVFGALGTGYLVLTPPLAAMDERGHLLSLLWETGHLDRREEAFAEGRRVHATRLAMHPDEKFAREDLKEPVGFFLQPDAFRPEVIGNFAPRARERSPLAARLWSLWSGRLASMDLIQAVLEVRTVHLWITAVVVAGCAVLLGTGLRGVAGAEALPWAFCLVPCLPHFGMILSNYPLLLAGSCLLASILALLAWGRAGGWAFGCAAGLGLGLTWHSSRAGLPVAATWCVTALALMAVPGRSGIRLDARAWLGFGLGLLATRGLSTAEYDAALLRQVPGMPGWAKGAPSWFTTGGMALAWLGGAALGWLLRRSRSGEAHPPADPSWIARTLNRGLAAAGVAWLVVGPWLSAGPRLADIEYYSPYPLMVTPDRDIPRVDGEWDTGAGVSAASYARQAVQAFWGSFGSWNPEFFTSRMFWSGFGAFDVLLPGPVIVGLGWIFFLGWVRLAWRAGSPGERPVSLGPLALGLGATLGVVLLALSCAGPPVAKRTLIGRYVMPWYVMFLVPALSGWLGEGRSLERWRAAWPVLALAAHGVALATIVTRYF